MINHDNLIGKKFNNLLILKLIKTEYKYNSLGKIKKKNRYYLCKCDCGKETVVCSYNLTTKNSTKSCGCAVINACKLNFSTHKLGKSRLYNIWNGIKQRCLNEHSKFYKNYGGRGIKVCDDWKHNFKIFHDWAINNGYSDELSIDRINNNGNYEPLNCHWVNSKIQAENRRSCIYIQDNDVKKTLKGYCLDHNLPYKLVWERIRRYGKTFEEAIIIKKNARAKINELEKELEDLEKSE